MERGRWRKTRGKEKWRRMMKGRGRNAIELRRRKGRKRKMMMDKKQEEKKLREQQKERRWKVIVM